MKRVNWEKRALAWLLCAGITVTSMPETAFAAAEFSDGTSESEATVFDDGMDFDDAGISESDFSEAVPPENEAEVDYPKQDYKDAVFSISWNDEHNLSGRRPEDIYSLVEIYADGAILDSHQFQLTQTDQYQENSGRLDTCEYVIEDLPVYQEDSETKVHYTLGLNEGLLPGYQAMTAESMDAAEEALLAVMAAPGDTLELEETDSGYTCEKRFGNYLPAYQVSGSIFWNDDSNEDGVRPDMEAYFANQFTVTRSQQVYPAARVNYSADENDPDCWNFTISGLFTTMGDGSISSYLIGAADVEGYQAENYTAEIKGSVSGLTFTYTKQEDEDEAETDDGVELFSLEQDDPQSDEEPTPAVSPTLELTPSPEPTATPTPTPTPEQVFTATFNVNTGMADSLSEEYKTAIQNSVTYTVNGTEYANVEKLQEVYPGAEITWSWTEKDDCSQTGTVTISVIVPSEEEKPVITASLEAEGLPGDYSVLGDGGPLADGASLTLTRTGTTEYSASKYWLDNTGITRPETVWELYRTVKDADGNYGSMELADDVYGKNVTWTLRTSKVHQKFNGDNTKELLTTSQTESDATLPMGGSVELPKYDENGNEYIYFAKETMSGSNAELYKSHIGLQNENGDGFKADGGYTDENGITYAANGGALTNRLEKNDLTASGEIIWIADQYKDQLGDVQAEMTLQFRRKEVNEIGAPVHEWENVTVENGDNRTERIGGFTSNVINTVTAENLPQYDSEGKELEYRWIQTAVYQGDSRIKITQTNVDEGTFKLSENESASSSGDEYFRSYIVELGHPYAGMIVNKLEGTTSLCVKKVWDDDIPEEDRGDSIPISLDQKDSIGRTLKTWENITVR